MENENMKVESAIQHLRNDIQLLEGGHVYEVDSVPGVPRCSTMANRMKENLDIIEKAYKESIKEK